MQKSSLARYSLFITIILWGVLLGGMVYSHIVYFPPYLSDLPNSAIIVNGKYALSEGNFWMTIHPLLILSLNIALILNWKFKDRRSLILMTMTIYFIVLICTALYFLPELGAFKASPTSNISPAEWLDRGNRWQYLSWIRGSVMFVGILPLLMALTKATDLRK